MISLNGVWQNFPSFPNGETAYKIDMSIVKRDFNEVMWKYESDADFMHLANLVQAIRDNTTRMDGEAGAWNTLHILNMPYARMDRGGKGKPNSLHLAVLYLSVLFNEFVVYEPHSSATLEEFNSRGVKVRSVGVTELLLKDCIDSLPKNSNLVLVYPDAGACERYRHLRNYNALGTLELTCIKTRDFATGAIESLTFDQSDGRVAYGTIAEVLRNGEGVTFLIVDDLSSYGGTFVRVADLICKEFWQYYNFGGRFDIELVVAHAEDSIFKGKLLNSIDKVWTTDSMLTFNLNPTKVDVKSIIEIAEKEGRWYENL